MGNAQNLYNKRINELNKLGIFTMGLKCSISCTHKSVCYILHSRGTTLLTSFAYKIDLDIFTNGKLKLNTCLAF